MPSPLTDLLRLKLAQAVTPGRLFLSEPELGEVIIELERLLRIVEDQTSEIAHLDSIIAARK